MDRNYENLINRISEIIEKGRSRTYHVINLSVLITYWNVGKYIVEFEQKGNIKSEYGSNLLDKLSKDLTFRLGKGFSRTNIKYMRIFYLNYKKSQTVSDQLSWSHYCELLKTENELERKFYEKQCIKENWSVRELRRQMNSALFHRLALSKDKKGILQLSKKGQNIKDISEVIKDPYILEFLKIPERNKYSEKTLENKIIDNLQNFLLELGKGFAFIGRQYRITLNNTHYYIDLLFYHRILKCFVLIDLKLSEVDHKDIGQMNMYLNYFKKEESSKNDNNPIGIILTARKDDILVEYATGGISNKIFVSKYLLYLPDKKLLEDKVKSILNDV